VQPHELPLSPPRIWQLIETARQVQKPPKGETRGVQATADAVGGAALKPVLRMPQ
jgi:hypothetical protein